MGGGEIVEVEGGHIVRSRGSKDRHSKVCTAKGPRDRRVRLSAHTAIEFYDVQDRLGYDRPSKALDWLIDKAKPAIDQLAQLPPWKPTLSTIPNPNPIPIPIPQQQQQNDDVVPAKENPNHNQHQQQHGFLFNDDEEKEKENIENHSGPRSGLGLGPGPGGGFLPFDAEMVDTIRSYFPATTSSSVIQFQSYPQDLRLSLQSYEDTSLNQNQHVQQHVLFTGTLDGMVPWNSGDGNMDTGNNDASAASGGFVFHAPSPAAVTLPMVMYGQNQYLSQRGPLQSSNTPSVRAWMDAPSFVAAADYRHCLSMAASSSTSALGAGFAPGGFSGFRVPARIWGDEEEEHGNMPSSASSDSRR